MKATLALITIDLKLAFRDRMVIFFNYLFPLIFFFVFGEMMGNTGSASISNVVTMVLSIGILGNGLWGAGMRLVQERENNILRRFKVTPISPLPILISSMITGWIIYIPAVLLICTIAHLFYGMAIPERWVSLLGIVSAGVFAFRAIGLIIASVVNSVQESTIAIQLFYMPMMFLSGATIPVALLPTWAQITAQFMPASYLMTGLQGVFLKGETLAANWQAASAMAVTVVLATFISTRLFRWEKGEKLATQSKLWVLAVLAPFFILGGYQAYSKEHIGRTETMWRELMRSDTILIRGARVFTGDGTVIERGAVLIRHGKIEEVFDGSGPEPDKVKAESIDGSGRTLLPGLIDARVEFGEHEDVDRAVAAQLYCGITTVGVKGPVEAAVAAIQKRVAIGQWLGAQILPAKDGDKEEPLSLAGAYLESASSRDKLDLLARPLVQQVGPATRLTEIKTRLNSSRPPEGARFAQMQQKFRRAHRDGAPLVAASHAGRGDLLHGPSLHLELRLWVKAGIPGAEALKAATGNAARALGVDKRLGAIRKGYDADLLLVEGNPLEDISATERVAQVIYKGERIRRNRLFNQK